MTTPATTALKIACQYCGAEPDQRCHNKITGLPLHKLDAHPIRITDALGRLLAANTSDDGELF